MLLSETFRQQPVVDWPGKWDVNEATGVHVPDFGIVEAEFSSATAIGGKQILAAIRRLQLRASLGSSYSFDE